MWMWVVIDMFLRAIAITGIGLFAIGHAFWNRAHHGSAHGWGDVFQMEIYGGILLICVGLFSAFMNYRRLRNRQAEQQQSTKKTAS